MFDWSTVAASGLAGFAGGAVAAGATLLASRRERQQAATQATADRQRSLQQAADERLAQRQLFDDTLRRADADREHARLELLAGVAGELRFNITLVGRAQTNRVFILFELDVMRSATWELAALPDDTRVEVDNARWAMLGYNTLAAAVNNRQPGVAIASEPPLDPKDVDELATRARPLIDRAATFLEAYVQGLRPHQPRPRDH